MNSTQTYGLGLVYGTELRLSYYFEVNKSNKKKVQSVSDKI